MPKGNPEGYLKTPKDVEKPSIKPRPIGKARATVELERRLAERRKKAKAKRTKAKANPEIVGN